MKMIRYFFILFFLLTAEYICFGQERINLQSCREMALANNKNLMVAAKQLEQAKAEKAAVKTSRLPNFTATGTGIYIDKDFEMEMTLPTQKLNPLTGEPELNIMTDPATGNPVIGPDGNPLFNMYAWLPLSISLNGAYLGAVSLGQPLYTGGKINAGCKMADIGVEMADENLELHRINTIVEADKKYWTYISVCQKVRLAEQVVEMLSRLLKRTRDSYQVEMVSKGDLLKVRVEYNHARLGLQKAKNGQELTRMDLCRITGLPSDTPIIAEDTVITVESPAETDSVILNVTGRPEYSLMQKNIDLQEQNIISARADFLPVAGIQTGYFHIDGIEFTDTDFSNSSFYAIATVKIPLFHWGEGKNKINSAKIDKEIKELELEKNRELLKMESEQARLNINLAWERVKISEEALLEAEENLRVSRDNYDVGMETITELLMAQTRWHEAFAELVDARADFKIKETIWNKARGRLIPVRK